MLGCQCDGQFAMRLGKRARQHDHARVRLACESVDCAFDLGWVAHVSRRHLHHEGPRRSLDRRYVEFPRWVLRIDKHQYRVHARCDLLEQLHPFAAERGLSRHETGDVESTFGGKWMELLKEIAPRV